LIPVFDIRTLPTETYLKPVIVDQYTIISITKAQGSYSLDFEKREVNSSTWIYLTPGQLYAQELSHTQGVMITFNESFLFKTALEKDYLQEHPLFHETFHPTYVEYEVIDQTNLDIILKLLNQEWNKEVKSEVILKSYLCILLELSQRLCKSYREIGFGKEKTDPRSAILLKQIEKSFSTHHDAQYYAKYLELTIKRANQICKESTGHSITELIHKRLNLEMKKRVGYSSDLIHKIASDLSFRDNAYFSTFFKKQNNCAPMEFRAESHNFEIGNRNNN